MQRTRVYTMAKATAQNNATATAATTFTAGGNTYPVTQLPATGKATVTHTIYAACNGYTLAHGHAPAAAVIVPLLVAAGVAQNSAAKGYNLWRNAAGLGGVTIANPATAQAKAQAQAAKAAQVAKAQAKAQAQQASLAAVLAALANHTPAPVTLAQPGSV
jgi:sirohydrochlorin ferrochelatase